MRHWTPRFFRPDGLVLGAVLLLPLLVWTPPAAAQAKLALHVQPFVSKVCTSGAPTTLGCNSSLDLIQTAGDLNVDYNVYVVAVDVYTNIGLLRSEFGIYYRGAAEGEGVDVFDWTSCADAQVAGATWPAPGSGISLTYIGQGCQGTTPDPNDTRGRGMAVLGALAVSAATPDLLWLIQRYDANFEFRVWGCNGTIYDLDYIQAGIVNFGGGEGQNPCLFHGDRFPQTCCLPENSCLTYDPLYCEFLGGIPLGFRPCSECTVPVEAATWGRIKSNYE